MQEFIKKKKKKNIIYSWPVLVILFLILGYSIKANLNIYEKVKKSEQKKEISENQLQELKNRQVQIEKDVQRLNSNIGQEEELRNRFNLVKDQEKVFIIVDEKKDNVESFKQEENKQGFIEKIKSWF